MAADYTDLLALMGDVLRAVDRQTEENKKAIDQLGNTVEQMGNRFEAIFNRFAEATADGFIRMEKKVEGVKEEVAGVKEEIAGLRTDVQQIDQRLARVEQNQATQADMLRRLEVLESIVLRKAS